VKIYTRKGDGGQTGIWGGARLAKDAPRMEAIGCVDELNAAIGLAVATAQRAGCFNSGDQVLDLLGSVQQDLTGMLPELRNFIVPGGTETAAHLHVARTVCRRAERRVTTLRRDGDVNPDVCAYLNRLADLLFVLARYANHTAGAADIIWAPRA